MTHKDPQLDISKGSLISQGAEARLWETIFLERPTIVKQRFLKKYRHPALDKKLTMERLKQESKNIVRARKRGVLTPVLYMVEPESSCLYFEKIVGKTVKELLKDDLLTDKQKEALWGGIGSAVAAMHDGDLVHGDLTTSNMMLRDMDNALVMIDFGLSYTSQLPEDKGVDLYVLERAITSAHPGMEGAFQKILSAYKMKSKKWNSTYNKYAEVRLRGRKRAMVG